MATGTQASISAPASIEDAVCQMALPTKVKPNVSFYAGSGGNSTANLPARGTPPTGMQALTVGLQVNQTAPNVDNFSARVSGYIVPTVSGNYTFYISSDDAGFFTLGAGGASVCALSLTSTIANAGFSGTQGASGAVSAIIALIAGVSYPFEAGYSDGAGGDYIQVDWSGPVGGRQVIPAAVLYERDPTKLARRQIMRVTASDGTVSYRDPYDNTVVAVTAAEPLVSCEVDPCSTASAGTVMASALPLADGVGDAQRTGAVGTSTNAAREDHIHPIAKLAQLTLPPLTMAGATINAQTVSRQHSTEETQKFQVQLQFTPTAVGPWRTVMFPALAGYNGPFITYNGVYNGVGTAAPYQGQAFPFSTTFYFSPSNTNAHWADFQLEYQLI